jgi:hypothetical protein
LKEHPFSLIGEARVTTGACLAQTTHTLTL